VGSFTNHYKPLGGAVPSNYFGEQLSGAILGYRFEELRLWGSSFGQQLCGQLWGAISCFEAQQLSSGFRRNFEQF